jgi:phage gp36-like protein
LKDHSKRRKHSKVDEEKKKRGSDAGEEVTGNNHIGGLGSIYLLPLAQVPKISRRTCFKISPWYARVPPWRFHCFNTLGRTSTATTKQE